MNCKTYLCDVHRYHGQVLVDCRLYRARITRTKASATPGIVYRPEERASERLSHSDSVRLSTTPRAGVYPVGGFPNYTYLECNGPGSGSGGREGGREGGEGERDNTRHVPAHIPPKRASMVNFPERRISGSLFYSTRLKKKKEKKKKTGIER